MLLSINKKNQLKNVFMSNNRVWRSDGSGGTEHSTGSITFVALVDITHQPQYSFYGAQTHPQNLSYQ